jgi:hypothetical protein
MHRLIVMSVVLALACSNQAQPTPDETATSETAETAAAPAIPTVCSDNGWPVRAWNTTGPFGTTRHALADDLTLPLRDGRTWTLSSGASGCDLHGFLVDTLPVSDTNRASIWGSDVDELVRLSPQNARWFFVSRQEGADARASLDAMQAQIDGYLAGLSAEDAAWWKDRLLVVDKPADKLDGWISDLVVRGIGQLGFAIDREQRLRGIGSLADVNRYNGNDGWPWDANLAYAAYDLRYLNRIGELQSARDAIEATVVPMWTGEVISGFAEMQVTLPGPDQMAQFDTFEIEIDMRCPDASAPEVGNCGAWDYLAYLWVQDGDQWVELSRFITTYHREAWWMADASALLPLLDAGGARNFKWEWAPPWNVQPTETRINLRFSNQGKPHRAVRATRLFTGGDFNSAYNVGREPVSAEVPANASKVELVASITGHGAGTQNCAEFCNHQHAFTVGDQTWLHEHEVVGDDSGCVKAWKDGMTPNQWGTWWFGRGGWCPGEKVTPFVADVTAQTTPGQPATVSYRGLLNGGEPPDGAGNILMNAWWVTYEARP